MLSFLVKRYIKKRAKISNRICPQDIEDMLAKEVQEYKDKSKKIIFTWLWDCGGRTPNASATIPGIILINAEWAARIVLFPDDGDMHNAFRLTMGHELTHQENDYFFLEPFTKNEKFVYWVNEVHADFGGIVKAFDGNIKQGLRAMEYKRKGKIREDKDTFMHPSWERRMRFVSEYDFGANLIREIANIVGCKNDYLIEKVINHYDEIILCKALQKKGKGKGE